MNCLKKSILGKYRAGDVDLLLEKVRDDYERCLKDQKDRIIKLREENKQMTAQIGQYRQNEAYVVGAMAKAEKAAEEIIEEARQNAKLTVRRAESQQAQIRTAAQVCGQRLVRLKSASEEICNILTKTIETQYTRAPSGTGDGPRPVRSIFDSMH